MFFSRRIRGLFQGALVAVGLLCGGATAVDADDSRLGKPAPEFTHGAESDWLNSKPLAMASLKGSVVMVEFWAFECWNCYRSFPWLNTVEQRYATQGLQVVSVHTPELPVERQRARLVEKIAEYQLHNPVMLDNDYSYWQAFGNRYWPAFYLIDRKGIVRGAFVGETHAGDANARQIETAIESLLKESA